MAVKKLQNLKCSKCQGRPGQHNIRDEHVIVSVGDPLMGKVMVWAQHTFRMPS